MVISSEATRSLVRARYYLYPRKYTPAMATNNTARDYLVGTVLVLVILAVSFLLIRLLNGVVEEEAAPQRLGVVVEVSALV